MAVSTVHSCHCRPRKDLYKVLLKYPATVPKSMYKTNNAIIRDPRRAGLRKPTADKQIENKTVNPSCAPEPQNTQKSIGEVDGGRNTSACTNFHPLSSTSSSSTPAPISASALYAAISRRRFRTKMDITNRLKNNTTKIEFVMEYQCTLAGTK